MSVWWMVDSADEIYQVSRHLISSPDDQAEAANLKAGTPLSDFPDAAANQCRLASIPQTLGNEWLVFVRWDW